MLCKLYDAKAFLAISLVWKGVVFVVAILHPTSPDYRAVVATLLLCFLGDVFWVLALQESKPPPSPPRIHEPPEEIDEEEDDYPRGPYPRLMG